MVSGKGDTWTAIGGTPPPGVATATMADLLDAVRVDTDHVVPFVGAGLALGAGAPSSGALLEALVAAAGRRIDDSDFFATVDALAAHVGEAQVQQYVADIINAAPIAPTATLMALAKAASRLIITTNYDSSIEVSAEAAGIPVVTATLKDVAAALAHPGDRLVVLHLHGIATDPSSIVLTEASYQRVRDDEAATLVVRARGVSDRLIFLGHQLAPREAHIRRDVAWATTVGAPRPTGGHLILLSPADVAAPEVVEAAQGLVDEAHLRVFAVDDPNRTFEAVKRVATIIAGPSAVDLEHLSTTFPRDDAHFVPHAVAPTEELSDDARAGAYLARTWRQGTQVSTDLDDRASRLLLVAGGGYGKTRELREIARRAPRPALYRRLNGVQRPIEGVNAGSAFVRWMAGATSATENPAPTLTTKLLADESFVILLDGLDEVRAGWRSTAVELLNEVVRAYPQHRWVVATRPVPEASQLQQFTSYTFAPDGGWLRRYAEQRGVEEQRVDEFLASTPIVKGLMAIPVFAVSVVDQLARGLRPPRTALDLVLALADARLERDQLLPAAPEDVQQWLDRLALLLQLRGTTQVDIAHLASTGLHHGLGFDPSPEVITELAVRALVRDTRGSVQFPANIIQEARAARALLGAGEAGKALLRERVMFSMAVVDADGREVTGVRPSWLGTLEMLLAAADESWRTEVAAVDPVLAARSTPSTASTEERGRAVWTLWRTYRARRVWLPRGYSGDERDDAGALRRLAQDAAPPGFVEELRQGLTDSEEAVRANALLVLGGLLAEDALVPLVSAALRDPHPVVRRQAAGVAYERHLACLADDLATRAGSDPDEMARDTLTDTAIDLARDEAQVIAFARAAPPTVSGRAWLAAKRRVPRATLLGQVPGSPARLDVLEVVLEDGWMHEPQWTEAEVAQLTAVLAALPVQEWYRDGVDQALASQPMAALVGLLQAPPGEEFDEALWRITVGWPLERVHDAAALLAAGVDEVLRTTGTGLGPLDARALARAREVLRHRSESLTRRTQNAATTRSPMTRTIDVASLITAQRFDDVLHWAPSTLAEPLDVDHRGRLTAWVHDEVLRLVHARALPLTPSTPDGPFVARDLRLVQWAVALNLDLPASCWLPVALLTMTWREQQMTEWVRQRCTEMHVLELLRALEGAGPGQVVTARVVVPPPWPPRFADTLITAALQVDPVTGEPQATVAAALEAGQDEALRRLVPEPAPQWLLPFLVQLGDARAEAALLSDLIVGPDQMTRWPLRGDASWLQWVRHAASADLVFAALRAVLQLDQELADTAALYAALERLEGPAVLTRYDELIADQGVPGAPFVFYQRQRALGVLVETRAHTAVDAAGGAVAAAVVAATNN